MSAPRSPAATRSASGVPTHERDRVAVQWLLASDEPAVRDRARTWLLDEDAAKPPSTGVAASIPDGPIVSTLLEFPDPPETPYRKWWGLHWRLVSLADFELPRERLTAGRTELLARLDRAIDRELGWIANERHLESIRKLDGLFRADASMEGNALYAAARFGRADDPRAERLAEKLLEWQWPDGGWNCDRRSSGYRSSFHESWATAIGLATYHRATRSPDALAAARRTAELLLEHHVYRTLDNTRPAHSTMAVLHWPAYWHYDLLAGLRVLRAVEPGLLTDDRARDALDRLESLRLPDGRYQANRSWWQVGRHVTSPVDVVDWGRGRPSEVLTLHALAILKAAGRLAPEAPTE